MAERKAVNKYYPPDWDPRKGSANKRVGQHPLRDRAKKLSQGILVIRFELPYNIWCGGCGSHIGMGVRYNAEKSKVGNYYSTPIYKFRMKCHLCDNYFEIQTDPKNHDYVILSGARRKEQRWDPVANGQVVPEDKATQKKLATDPMYKLEHGSDDQQKGKDKVMSLAQIEESRVSMLDDYILNRMARDKFRAEKKQLKEAAEAEQAILERASLSIDLVEESEEDKRLAVLMKYSVTSSFEEKQKERRKSIEQRPIFSTGESLLPTSLPVSTSTSTLCTSPNQRHNSVAVSQHGDLKQKLGKALQAMYTDPFKYVGKRSGVNKSSSSKPIRSKLGIRLKAIESTTAVSTMLKMRNNDKADVAIKFGHKEEANIGEDLEPANILKSFTSDAVSKIARSVTEEKDHCNVADSTSELPDKSSERKRTELKTLVPLDLPSSVAEDKNGYTQQKFKQMSCSNQDQDDTEEHILVQTSPRKCDLSSHTAGDVLHVSNTSLQALMCSYTDSDSESNS